MTLNGQASTLKKTLLGGVSVVAFTIALNMADHALADANGGTAVTDGDTVSTTDTGGLIIGNSVLNDKDHTIIIDSDTGAITLGDLDTTDSITFETQDGNNPNDRTATFNITSSGTNNGVIFAGDIDVNGDENIEINATNTTTVFQGNVEVLTGTATITVGDGSGALTIAFDTAAAGNNTIDAVINASATNDVITLQISNSETTATNTLIFDQDVGGTTATETIDNVLVASGANATFNGTVLAGTIFQQSTGTLTFNDTVTGDIRISADGTVTLGDTAAVTGNIDNTSGTAGVGTLNVNDQTTGPLTAVSGNIGATNSLKEVNVDSTSNTVTFGGTVNAVTINLTGAGDTDETIFQDDVTGNIVINTAGLATFEADKKLVGAITTDTDGEGIIEFETQTADTVLVSGAIGTASGNALKEVIVNTGAGVTSTFGSTVDADTVTVDGTGTLALLDDVTADTALNFADDGTAIFLADKKLVGNADSDTGDEGTLIFSEATTNTTLVSGTVGASNALKEVRANAGSGVTVTFGGTVNATTVTAAGAGTTAFSDDVTGNVDIEDGGTVSVAAGQTITGNVDNSSGADNSGTLTIAAIGGNIDVVDGTIGATNTLAQVTVDTTGGDADFTGAVETTAFTATGTGTTSLEDGGTIGTLTASGDVSVEGGTLNLTGNMALGTNTLGITGGDVDFTGTAAQTITGLIDGANNLTVSNAAGVTFESALGSATPLAAVTIGSGNSGIFESTLDAASIDLDGSVEFNDLVTLSGNFDTDGGTITVGSGFNNGDTVVATADVVSANTTSVQVSPSLEDGTYVLFDSTADASGDLANLSAVDSALQDLTLAANGNDIELTVAAKTAATIATELGVSSQEATAALEAGNALDGAGDETLLANYTAAINGTTAQRKKAVQTVGVQADTLGATADVAINLGGQVLGISSDRLSSQRVGEEFLSARDTGINAGALSTKNAAWFKGFGSYASQDSDGADAGFDALTYGVAFGYDRALGDGYRAGASFTYASSDVDGEGAGESGTDISSYQATLYGDFTGKAYYAEAAVAFAFNSNDTSRIIDFLGTDTEATGEYNSYQYMASFNTGVPIQLSGTAYFTPTAGISWTHISTEDYTETGAGGLNQRVELDDINVLLGSLGAKFHTQIRTGEGYLVPELRGGVSYDFIGDNAVATATYTGGGSAFTVEGSDVEQFGGNLGLGLTYDGGYWTFGGTYDMDLKSGYISHSGVLKARFKF